MRRLVALLACCTVFMTACGSNTPTKEQLVQLAVAATLSSLPRNTPVPPPTFAPTPTPVRLSGLFCEYQFCIGHPSDLAFYDVSAVQTNQSAPSTYSQGDLAAHSSSLFLQMLWQDAPGVTDPQFMLDLIMQYSGDTRGGSVEPKLIGSLNVYAVQIAPTGGSSSIFPFGVAAAWTCGGRAFAWKVFAPQQELASAMMTDALGRFRCEAR